jgi:hypothetical protein
MANNRHRSVAFDSATTDSRDPAPKNSRLARTVTFVPSQIGGPTQVPISYTSTPGRLLWYDFRLFLSKISSTTGVFLPLRWGRNSEPYDELYPSLSNILSFGIHVLLAVMQLVFLCSFPVYLFAPCAWWIVYVMVFFGINGGICRMLNGSELKVYPSVPVDEEDKFRDEYWIFMNGVACGFVLCFVSCV